MNMLKSFLPLFLVIVLSFGLMGGCGGGGSSGSDDGGGGGSGDSFKTVLVDATAGGLSAPADDPANKFTYLDLSTGEVLPLTDSEAESSADWDIAFKRSTVILNGGISGAGDVSGYFTSNNSEAYDGSGDAVYDWFANATAESEFPDFNAVTSADIPLDGEGNPDGSAFTTDSPLLAVTGDGTSEGWWLYDFATHTVSANDANWWVVRSDAGDSYAKFHVTEILLEGSPEEWVITLEMDIQGAGETGFTSSYTYTAYIPLSGDSVYFDFDTLSEVASGGGWDLLIEYNAQATHLNIYTNGGMSGPGDGGAFPLYDQPGTVSDGSDTSHVPFYMTDSAGGIFIDSGWYAYNITGSDHQLWPNYRVYLVYTGTEVYKLQILSYYHPQTAESAWYTVRYEKIWP